MASTSDSVPAASLKRFVSPQTVVGRFVARRSWRPAALWALALGAYMTSKTLGYVSAYPSAALREKLATSFSSNVGIQVLLGQARHIDTIAGFIIWNTLSIAVMVGAIWGFLIATKTFRGEEEAGRWELMLSGHTTARRAAANALAGLGASLAVFYVVLAAVFTAVGHNPKVALGSGAMLFFALAIVSGIALFVLVGAFVSQLMPTRSRAASVSAFIFGICFVLRAVADTTSAHWLLNVTPLGWIEKLQPLYASQPLWLVPLAALMLILGGLTMYLAGKRDLGTSHFADKDSSRPRTALLNAPFAAAVRFTQATTIAWLLAIGASSTLYALLTKTAAQAFSQSPSASRVLTRLTHQSQLATATTYLGVVFFLQMVLIMAYAASSVGAIRKDEASGYLDNLLVRPVSRLRYLAGRVALGAITIVLAGLLTSVCVWAAVSSQHLGISFHTLLSSSLNALAPVLLTFGAGIFAFGFWPRLTTIGAYGVLVWAFLIDMLGSGINLNHWIKDTSVLNQVAPAVNPNWHVVLNIIILAVALGTVGLIRFCHRDLENE